MEAILLHPENEEQLATIKNLAKEMKISFETKREEDAPYSPEFIAKIMRSREDSENGRVTVIKTADLWK